MPERHRLRSWVEQGWYGGPPRLLLRPLAMLYAAGITLRRQAYRGGLLASSHPGVPTVVVGNLSVGGTGKTPLVAWLAERLRAQGRRPGVVLRGYGGRQRAPRLVDAADDAALVGDEALLLARRGRFAVAIGAQRAAAAALLVRAGCDIVIADDGLQHLALRRDLDIVVVDGGRGFGNGALLPAGPLREPPARLQAAGLVVLHGADRQRVLPADLRPVTMRLAATALHRLADGAEQPLESLRGASVHALAGIGHPQRFFGMLRALGASPIEHPLPDHHRYRRRDLDFGDGLRIVMTEKDAVKCAGFAAGRDDVFCLAVTAVLAEPDAARLLDHVLAIGRVEGA